MTISLYKKIGSILIVAGTEIGAGILAIPIITAKMGFPLSVLVMLFAWGLMMYTAILLADVTLQISEECSFGQIAKKVLGKLGEFVSSISFFMLLYAISIAYISATNSTIHSFFPDFSVDKITVLFVFIVAIFIIKGVSYVDIVNRLLSSFMIFLFIFVCFLFFKHVNLKNFVEHQVNTGILIISLPILVTSFTSHLIIPSLRIYLNSDPKVMLQVILIGSLIPLILYILWNFSILGVIPLHGSNSFINNIFSQKSVVETNISDVLLLLKNKMNYTLSYKCIHIFSLFALITSYLGVSLALFHFFKNEIKHYVISTKQTFIISVICTFVIPLIIVLIYPNLFIRVLSYVGSCCSILLIILPVLMIEKLQKQNVKMNYRLSSNKILRKIAFVVAILVILADILSHLPFEPFIP